MPRETLLQESVRETKETLERFFARNRYFTALIVAIVVAAVGIVIGLSRGDDDPSSTQLRADQKTLTSNLSGGDGDTKPDSNGQYPTASTYNFSGNSGQTGTSIDGMKGINANVHPPPRSVVVTVPNGTPVTTKDGAVVTTLVQDDPSPTTPTTSSGGHTNTTAPATGGGFNSSAFNSGRIAYVSGGAVWTVTPTGGDPQKVASGAYFPAWSRGRTTLAMSDADSPGGSLSYVSYTGGRFALTTGPSGSGNGDSAPSWSPDGTQVAFARIDMGGSDGYSSIWIVNKDGSASRRIVNSPGCFNRDPSWSPDGAHIVFWSSRDHCGNNGQPLTGEYELYIVNPDGSGLKRLGTPSNSGSPTFSPDGQRIAFASDRTGNFEIWSMNVDGSDQTRLTTASGDDTDPSYSPDGTRIAFRSARNGGGIFTMKTDGTDVQFVVTGSQPAWS